MARQLKDIKTTLTEEGDLFEKHKDDPRDAGEYVQPLPAREPAQVYSIRIPSARLIELKSLAEEHGMPVSTMIRHWVLERLDTEQDPTTIESMAEDAAAAASRLKSALKTRGVTPAGRPGGKRSAV